MTPIHSNLLAGHLIANRLVADSRVAEPGVLEKRLAETQRRAEHRGADVSVMAHVMGEDELDALMLEFADHCERADWKLTEAQEIQNFERFASVVRKTLESLGSLSEDRLDEADFTLRKNGDPTHVLRVRSAVVITEAMAQALLEACLTLGSDVALMFAGHHGRAVLFSNGDWIKEE